MHAENDQQNQKEILLTVNTGRLYVVYGICRVCGLTVKGWCLLGSDMVADDDLFCYF